MRNVPSSEGSPLQDVQALHPADGPSLPLDQQLRRGMESEIFPPVPLLCRTFVGVFDFARGLFLVQSLPGVSEGYLPQADADFALGKEYPDFSEISPT